MAAPRRGPAAGGGFTAIRWPSSRAIANRPARCFLDARELAFIVRAHPLSIGAAQFVRCFLVNRSHATSVRAKQAAGPAFFDPAARGVAGNEAGTGRGDQPDRGMWHPLPRRQLRSWRCVWGTLTAIADARRSHQAPRFAPHGDQTWPGCRHGAPPGPADRRRSPDCVP